MHILISPVCRVMKIMSIEYLWYSRNEGRSRPWQYTAPLAVNLASRGILGTSNRHLPRLAAIKT